MKLIPISTDLNQTPSRWSLKFSPKINVFIIKMAPTSASFYFFSVFSNSSKIFTTNKCGKMIHLECGAGIQTHNLLTISLLP